MDHDSEAFYNWACENPIAKEFADIMRSNRVSVISMRRPDIVGDLTGLRDEKGLSIPLLAAKDIVAEFLKDDHFGSVAIYWDIENVHPPRGVSVAEAANCLAMHLGKKHGEVVEFKTYVDPDNTTLDTKEILSLSDCNVDVIYATHTGRKEVVDKLIIVDALWFAQEARRKHPDKSLPTICIVSGDSDYSPLLSKLSRAGFHTICVCGAEAKLRSIHQQARAAFTWSHFGLVGHGVPNRPSSPAAGVETTTQLDEDPRDPVDDLREAILSCQADQDGRVRRSQAGVFFQRNSVSGLKFSEVVAMAVERGVAEKGGTGGGAWVRLASQQQVHLMVVTNNTNPDSMPAGYVRSLSFGYSHRFVYTFSDTVAMTTFITYFPRSGGQEFREINDVDEIEMCVVDGKRRLLSDLVQNRGYAYLFGHPNRSGRMCGHRPCNQGAECTFIHLRSGATAISPSAITNYPQTATAEDIHDSLEALVTAIKRSSDKVDAEGHILRGTVALIYNSSLSNGSMTFKEISKLAEERGLVEMGGSLGHAWIRPLWGGPAATSPSAASQSPTTTTVYQVPPPPNDSPTKAAVSSASPSAPPNYDYPQTPSAEDIHDSLEALVTAIKRFTPDAEGHILRATVGIAYKGPIPFKEISRFAKEQGVVEMGYGGTMGSDWIMLRS